MQGRFGPLSLSAAYGYVDATFQSTFNVAAANNSSANGAGDITVQSGDTIPAIPKHNMKVRAEYAFTSRFSAGTNLIYASDQYARGDENNQDANGKVPDYFVVNLDARFQVTNQLQIFGKITNLFDSKYETFGVLGENFFNGPGFTYDQTLADRSVPHARRSARILRRRAVRLHEASAACKRPGRLRAGLRKQTPTDQGLLDLSRALPRSAARQLHSARVS